MPGVKKKAGKEEIIDPCELKKIKNIVKEYDSREENEFMVGTY